MSDFQDVLNNLALVVGGTRPDAANFPYWYSGFQTGDGSGVTGLQGCWSRPPEAPTTDGPFGILLAHRGTRKWGVPEERHDLIRLLLLIERSAGEVLTQYGLLTPFVDLIPSAFAARMQIQPAGSTALTGQQLPLQAFPTDYQEIVQEFPPGTPWLALEWIIDFERAIIQSYTA